MKTGKPIGRPRSPSLAGKRFGRLIAIEDVGKIGQGSRWRCQCDCGSETIANGYNLTSGNTTSCGCYHAERQHEVLKTHGMRHTRVYTIWLGMIQRCTNPNNPAWANYGGRGITVCPEWMSFDAFYADMGDPPSGLSIERTNNNIGYVRSNCRWATKGEQSRNKRTNRLLTHNGKTQTTADWSRDTGIRYTTIHARIRRGWPVERVLSV